VLAEHVDVGDGDVEVGAHAGGDALHVVRCVFFMRLFLASCESSSSCTSIVSSCARSDTISSVAASRLARAILSFERSAEARFAFFWRVSVLSSCLASAPDSVMNALGGAGAGAGSLACDEARCALLLCTDAAVVIGGVRDRLALVLLVLYIELVLLVGEHGAHHAPPPRRDGGASS
jgi:hypothetical protein